MASTGEVWKLGHRPALDGVRGIAALLVVIAAAVSAAAAVAQSPSDAAPPACSSYVRHATTGSGVTTRVVGDSFTQGYGLSDPTTAWPRYLPGRIIVDGFGGSGFTTAASPCPGSAFADRAAGAADLLVIQGGVNDWQQPHGQIVAGLRRAMSAATAPVVVVGPTAAPSRLDGAQRVDRLLARHADSLGYRYVSVFGLDLPYLADDLHLTPVGHRRLGEYVAAQMR